MSFFDIKARKQAAAAANGSANGSSAPRKQDKDIDPTNSQPWVEKYRPKTLSDVTAQDHTVTVLQRTLQASNLPHMLFYGPPGTGKTSTILALAKELYGPELMRARVLELNASDERGISIVREKVKDFARMQLTNPPAGAAYRARYPCPPFKIIILDEADSMTQDAQSALRRTMETYSRITRFCLVCNYVTRIIDPLASRCSKFRFKSLDRDNARRRLEDIAASERVTLAPGAVDALIRCGEGDLRKAITYLQSAARLVGTTATTTAAAAAVTTTAAATAGGRHGAAVDDNMTDVVEEDMDVDGADNVDASAGAGVSADAGASASARPVPVPVTARIVEDIAGVIPEAVVDRLVDAIRPKASVPTYQAVAKVVEDLVADGWSAGQVVSQLYQAVVYDEAIPDPHKNKIVLVFSDIDKRLVDGADEHLSILDLAMRIAGILSGK